MPKKTLEDSSKVNYGSILSQTAYIITVQYTYTCNEVEPLFRFLFLENTLSQFVKFVEVQT